MRLKVAICEDMPMLLEAAKVMIKKIRPEYVIDAYKSGAELLDTDKEYDITFLDIGMPEMDGMEVARNLRKKGYKGFIIFLSGYTEYMQEAFKVGAFRYLTKPLEVEMLKEAVESVERRIEEDVWIEVEANNTINRVKMYDILYIESNRNNTFLYTKREIIKTRKTMSEWLEMLGDKNFCQVHRSYIVSFYRVKGIGNSSAIMQYTDKKIPISKLKEKKTKEAYREYVEEHMKIIR